MCWGGGGAIEHIQGTLHAIQTFGVCAIAKATYDFSLYCTVLYCTVLYCTALHGLVHAAGMVIGE